MPAPRFTAIATAVFAILTPAVGLPTSTIAKAPSPPKACFYARNVDGFSALRDERTVYLRVGARTVYEAQLFAPCTNIDWTHHIALRTRGSAWVCEGSGAMDAEIFSPSPIGPQRCPVTSIRKLSPEELAALPKKYRP